MKKEKKFSIEKSKTLLTVFIIILAIAMITGTVIVYIDKMNDYIYSSTVQSIKELASHDIMSIESFLNNNWNRLGYITTKIKLEKCTTVNDIHILLEKERIASEFESVFLVDDKGNAYYDDYTVSLIGENSYEMSLIKSEDEKMVIKDDYYDGSDEEDEMLLYGIKTEPIKVGDINIVAVFARTRLKSIEKNLRIESFNNQGYSVVYNRNGDMVVNIESNSGKRENFYKQINESIVEGEYTEEDIREFNSNNETYIFRYVDSNGISKVLYSAPIKNTQWTFVLVVPYEVFIEQSQTFVFMIISLIAIIISILLIIVYIIFTARRSVIKARADSKAKSEFLSNMSHEMRTPLNGIIGLNQLMRTHIDDTEKMKMYIEKNTVTAEYLLSVVNEVLDMSKLQANKIEIVKKPFSLDELIDNVTTMQKNVFELNGIDFSVKTDILHSNVIGDMMRIEQVLMNILGNASKFTARGGKTEMLVSQKEGTAENTVETTFVISDTGCGMSQEFQKKIFDAFSQERSQNPQSIKGTGLGMSISYLLMKEMGGNISVKSQLGVGSTFTVVLQLKISDSDVLLPDSSKEIKEIDGKPLNILLAEDNLLNAEILMEILADEKISVTHAENGEEAVKIFEKSQINEFDAILMDIQMPVMNGYEASKAIRSLNRKDAKTIMIFACTANAFQEDENRAIESGMNDFIAKPINVSLLLKKLSQAQGNNEG